MSSDHQFIINENNKTIYKISNFKNFLNARKNSINKEYPIINSEENINKKASSEKIKMEIKFSCRQDNISEFLDDVWINLKESPQEKISTWKYVSATNDCNLEKDKVCKITKPIKLVKREFIYQNYNFML